MLWIGWLAAGLAVAATYLLSKYISWIKGLEKESGFSSAQCMIEDPLSLDKAASPNISKEATKTLSIIFPSYNEDGRIQNTLTETLGYLQKRRDRQGPGFTYEVIVVDDGSKDATTRVAVEYARRYGTDTVKVVRLVRNRGKAYAIKCGVLVARGQLILFADADGATPVSEVAKLEAGMQKILSGGATSFQPVSLQAQNAQHVMRAEGVGLVLGSRAHLEKEAVARRTWFRNFLMHGFHFLVMMVVGSSIKDTQCGFKLMSRQAARLLFGNMRLQRWCFDVELIYLAEQFNMPMGEVSVSWTEIPGSKVKFMGVVHMFMELLTIRVAYSLLGLWQIRSPADATG